jgi:hypothetical protein
MVAEKKEFMGENCERFDNVPGMEVAIIISLLKLVSSLCSSCYSRTKLW